MSDTPAPAEQDSKTAQASKRRKRAWPYLIATTILMIACALFGLKLRYGGGVEFPDRSSSPIWPESRLELVANLPTPPGNIAVSQTGRIFFTLHPEARPDTNLVEWRQGRMQPWPSNDMQPGGDADDALVEVLSIRIDDQQRVWALDNGIHGLKPGRLLAFDLETGEIVHRYRFPREIAALGSHLNDFAVSPDGNTIYIADASFFGKKPAIIVYDVLNQAARRVITKHESVEPEYYVPVVQGRAMTAFGLVSIRPGVDSITLSHDGNWLYFAPITNNYMYRVATRHLRDSTLSRDSLLKRIKRIGPKTMSDGISIDVEGNLYLSDLEHDAIIRMSPNGDLTTLLQSEQLRWPDGFGFGPDNYLYVTASSLHQVLGLPPSSVRKHAPYQVYRVKNDLAGRIGH